MFTNIEKIITIRNLKPKKKEGFLKVISAFSFIGIMLGVAVLIIVMSVMNGFRSELTQKILGFNPHISIKPYSKKVDAQFIDKLQKEFDKNGKVIKSYDGEAVILTNGTAKGILIKGIEEKEIQNLSFFKENIIDGSISDLKEGTIIIGKQLAIELGVVVGDNINIMSSSLVITPAGSIPKQSSYEIVSVFSIGE